MKKEIRGLLLMTLVCLAALMLSGCRMTDEVLDREMRAFNACMESGDTEVLRARFHPDFAPDDAAYAAWFADAQRLWRPISAEKIDLDALTVSEKTGEGYRIKSYNGNYFYKYDQMPCELRLEYIESNGLKGLKTIHFASVTASMRQYYWELGFSVILSIFGLMTIIDIIRKKPKYYRLWIAVVSLLYIPITLFGFRSALPVGVMIYWWERKKLVGQRVPIKGM